MSDAPDQDLDRTLSTPLDPSVDVTRLLAAAAAGNGSAARDLLPLVYRSLQELAGHQMRNQRAGHTLQATALVHEAYIRLVGKGDVGWDSRAHFYAAAAEAMRHILIDHARRVGAKKRGGGQARQIASVVDLASKDSVAEALEIDDAIAALRERDPRAASVIQLRFFAGLSIDDTAAALNLAPSTVDREWRYARAWLSRRLRRADGEEAGA